MLDSAKHNPAPGFQKNPDYPMLVSDPVHLASAALNGVTLAKTKNAIRISENTYDAVIYFPRTDVDLSTLRSTETSSFCPFKGTASYWAAAAAEGGQATSDIAWSYENPFDEAHAIREYIAFYTSNVTVKGL